jgi:beta-glucosidase
VVYGEDPYAEGVGDRPTVDYQPGGKTDLELLEKLGKADVPVVSVFLTGRPLWVNPEINASDAFVVAWLPGSEGGGVADVLFKKEDGSVNHDFEGRLSFSWPRTAAQAVVNRGDADYDPQFPYGYGLSYASAAEVPPLPEDRGVAEPSPGPGVYFDGGPVAPWRLFVGSPANWLIEATTARTTTQGSEDLVVENIDRRVQEDARLARWAGTGLAYLALSTRPAVDLSSRSEDGFALAFDVRVDEPPTAPVNLSMSCGMPCRGSVDLQETLADLAPGEWHTLRVPLSCLAAAGADTTRIDSPFGLATTGKLSLAFSDVRLVPGNDGPTVCPE